MLPRGSGTSSSESFNGSCRRPVSPLMSSFEASQRSRLHEELEKKATAAFDSSHELVNKLDTMHKSCDLFGNWSLTTEVEGKLHTFKEALKRDDDGTQQNLWDLVQADLIISHQQAKMNEMLLKSNADLKLQLAFARETVHRKQSEALEALNSVVSDSLSLLKERQEEAFDWKSRHHEQKEANQAIQKELKQLGKALEEANAKIGELGRDKMALEVDLEQSKAEVDVHMATTLKLGGQVQELQKKNRDLQMQVDQKTDEVVALDSDVRQAAVDFSDLRAKNKAELERYSEAFQKKLDSDLHSLEKELKNDHQAVVEQLQNQIARLENDCDMLNGRLAEARGRIGHVEKENDYLRKNAKKIKQDLISQCQRRVFSALNYDTQSTDSSPPERPRLPFTNHQMVHFQQDELRQPPRPHYEEDRSAPSNPPPQQQRPLQRSASPSQPQQRQPSAAAPPQKVSLSSMPVKKKPTGFIRRPL